MTPVHATQGSRTVQEQPKPFAVQRFDRVGALEQDATYLQQELGEQNELIVNLATNLQKAEANLQSHTQARRAAEEQQQRLRARVQELSVQTANLKVAVGGVGGLVGGLAVGTAAGATGAPLAVYAAGGALIGVSGAAIYNAATQRPEVV